MRPITKHSKCVTAGRSALLEKKIKKGLPQCLVCLFTWQIQDFSNVMTLGQCLHIGISKPEISGFQTHLKSLSTL